VNKTEALVAFLEEARRLRAEHGEARFTMATRQMFKSADDCATDEGYDAQEWANELIQVGGAALLLIVGEEEDEEAAERTLDEWLAGPGAKLGPLRGARP
jgi:hypothetical protein